MDNPYIAILILLAFAIVFCAAFLTLSWLLGPKHPNARKLAVYECGVPPVGDARDRFHVKYSLVAILFVIFDVEAVFLYPWAVRAQALGWYGFAAITLFLVILTVGLAYEWKRGAMEWR
ncbi:MAG: NADH-quinone oxidoreductase subunit A [Myxococcales bacterium]|nr:NADH-quinone oxidoreductase subunit A [Myxococcales bacterium]